MHAIQPHAGAKDAWKELRLDQDIEHISTKRKPKEEDFNALLDDA